MSALWQIPTPREELTILSEAFARKMLADRALEKENAAEADEFPVHPALTPLEIKEGTFGTPEWSIAVNRDARHFGLK